MNVRLRTVSCAALMVSAFSGTAWAQEPVNHSKTRAEVMQELEKARVQGEISVASQDYPQIRRERPVKTRTQVLQELEQAKQEGVLDFFDDEYPVLRSQGATKTRAQVLQELEHARQYGGSSYVAP